MGVILDRHIGATLSTLGDGTLVAPNYPGQFERADGYAASTTSYVAFDLYPSTTPDELVKVIRGSNGLGNPGMIRIMAGPCGYTNYVEVTAGFPPGAITGSPFTSDTITSTPYANLFPRWTGETAWDLQAFPATESFTPQGLGATGVFSYTNPGISDAARFGVSFATGIVPNDPAVGGDSLYTQEASFKVFAQASEVCCWNEGATLELNVDIWKIDFTTNYVTGAAGYHDFTLGTSSFFQTVTQTVTVDPSWESASFVPIHTFLVSQTQGYFTFVNDFYISAVNNP